MLIQIVMKSYSSKPIDFDADASALVFFSLGIDSIYAEWKLYKSAFASSFTI